MSMGDIKRAMPPTELFSYHWLYGIVSSACDWEGTHLYLFKDNLSPYFFADQAYLKIV